jgi:hypothetical protein
MAIPPSNSPPEGEPGRYLTAISIRRLWRVVAFVDRWGYTIDGLRAVTVGKHKGN